MKSQSELVNRVKSKSRLSNAMTCASTALGLVPPLVVVWLVGSMWQKTLDTADIGGAAVLLTGVLATKAGLTYLATWQAHRVAYGCLSDLRQDIISKLRELPLGFFQTRKVGDLANIVKNDVEQVEVYLAHGLPETMSATALPVVVGLAMAALDWRLALAMVCGLPAMLVTRRISAPAWAQGFEVVARHTTTMQERLTEYVSTIPVIKAFGKSEDKTEQVIGAASDYVTWVTNSMNAISVPMGLISLCMEAGLAAVVAVGVWLLQAGQIGVEQLIVALVLAGAFTSSVTKTATLQHYRVMFERAMSGIATILDASVPKRPQEAPAPDGGDLVVAHVGFRYPGTDRTVLQDVNITCPTATTTALVGSSGCGKSTLAYLMMGFWDPDEGRVSVGGVSPKEVPEREWTSLFAIVQQDVFMFNLSLAENIRIGSQDASFDQVVAAARKARIHDFIMTLPQGYDTLAGEAGSRFSGGERQRLSIARAILKDCPIVILDEATSALDAENEALVKAAIDELGQEKTIVTIAHHLGTVASADQIVVMDAGQVVDAGSHEELLARCATYQKMVADQHLVDTWDIKRGR